MVRRYVNLEPANQTFSAPDLVLDISSSNHSNAASFEHNSLDKLQLMLCSMSLSPFFAPPLYSVYPKSHQ